MAAQALHQKTLYRSAILLVSLMMPIAHGHADDNTRYIRDWMTIPLRATAQPDSKIVHSGLVSGNAVTILESDDVSGYSRVRAANGTEGWVATRYLTAEPIARMQLEKATAELEQLRKLKNQLTELPTDVRAAVQQVIDLRNENARLQTELDNLNKTPTEAAQLSAENTRLKTSSAALQQQLATLTTELQVLNTSIDRAQFRNGALAVIAGMFVVVCVRRLWPKKKSEWS